MRVQLLALEGSLSEGLSAYFLVCQSNSMTEQQPWIFRWFVPTELNRDAESRLPAIRAVVFGFAMLFWAPIFAPIYHLLGSPRGAAVILLTAVAIMLSMLSLRLTKSVVLTGNLIAAAVYICLVALAGCSGGMESASLWWLAAVPIIGLLLCGIRSGIAWTIVSCVAGAVFFILAWNGISVQDDILAENHKFLDVAALCGIIVCATTLTLTFKLGEDGARKAVEDARDASEEANRAKSEFLANMSHEIRTPMNGILGLTELVLESQLSVQQRDFLTTVHESGDNLLAILDEILDFSKIEAGKMELETGPFDLQENLGDTLKVLGVRAQKKGLELTCHIHRDVPRFVVGDATRLRQIIVNLVGNAVKFTRVGEVALDVDCRPQDSQEVTLHFAVRDTGIGIPQEKQETVFCAFEQADGSTTRQYGGTGLGLAISSRLAEAMQGQIWVESEAGRGSTFHFTAVLLRAESRVFDPRMTDQIPLRGVRVLVVDDNCSSQRSLKETLLTWGMVPEFAADGFVALQMVRRSIEQRKPYRLLLIDARMPGMNGFELAERVREEQLAVGEILMMLTSGGPSADTDRCDSLRIAGRIRKPIMQFELLDAFAAALREPGEKDAGPIRDSSSSVARLDGVKILLAEDSLVNQKVIAGLLERQGSKVTIANNGRAALRTLDAEDFDLVLMDVQMPEMDGLEAAAEIRRREQSTKRHLPIIAVTAHAMKEDRDRCLDAGMDEYLTKPVRSEHLYDTIDLVLRGAPASRGRAKATVNSTAMMVDWDWALRSVHDDREILQSLVESALQEAPAMMEAVRQAIGDRKTEDLRMAAHSLKQSFRYLGVPEVLDEAVELERMGRDGCFERAAAIAETLAANLQHVLQELRDDTQRSQVKDS